MQRLKHKKREREARDRNVPGNPAIPSTKAAETVYRVTSTFIPFHGGDSTSPSNRKTRLLPP